MRISTVESSTLATVAYDEAQGLLQLGFCTQAVYQYFGVPAAVHLALLGAPSKGRFFNRSIRGRFPYRLLPDCDAVPPHAEVPAGCDR
jgi:KTSC domain